jgi:hypothetical protein
MMSMQGTMTKRIIAERRKELLQEAAQYRLACQAVRTERTWWWAMSCRALLWLGHLFTVLGHWLERQGMKPHGRAAHEMVCQ